MLHHNYFYFIILNVYLIMNPLVNCIVKKLKKILYFIHIMKYNINNGNVNDNDNERRN